MTDRLDPNDRDILQFRPKIEFVEPDSEPQAPNPVEVPPERPTLETISDQRQRLRALAEAVNTLAAAVQARADQKADGFKIALDPNIDQDTIQAMRRHFPNEDPLVITYDQYRECKDAIRNHAEKVGLQGIITPAEINNRRDELNAGKTNIGGFGTPEANAGGLRPELSTRGQLIPPMDIQKLQVDLICILINFIWKNFLKPFIVASGPPVSFLFEGLPDKICDAGEAIQIPDLFILGDRVPKILTGEAIPEIPTSLPEF